MDLDGLKAAAAAAPLLRDEPVADALVAAARRLRERRADVLAANNADVEDAAGRLDGGALDRLRLTGARLDEAEQQLQATAALPPLERELERWRLPNGLSVETRRIPVGLIGAIFEARPLVALDVAGQLLKSLNACVLRTGSAALRTVTVLVDDVLRPALAEVGLPPELVALVRSADRSGAHELVSLPRLVPLVILRGSGAMTAELTRRAAAHGVATIAHAEGGGVLYVDQAAAPATADALVRASVDRLGVCNRLNVLLVHRAFDPAPLVQALAEHGIAAVDAPLGHEWAGDAERIASVTLRRVDSLEQALELANTETSGLAAAIATEDGEAARAFLDGYRGTAVFWNAPTRFTDGYALTGTPETGINVGWSPGPRGPVTYRDLWLRQWRVVGDGTQRR